MTIILCMFKRLKMLSNILFYHFWFQIVYNWFELNAVQKPQWWSMVLCTAREECRTKTKNGMLNEGVNQAKEFEKLFGGIECWYFFWYGFRLGILMSGPCSTLPWLLVQFLCFGFDIVFIWNWEGYKVITFCLHGYYWCFLNLFCHSQVIQSDITCCAFCIWFTECLFCHLWISEFS